MPRKQTKTSGFIYVWRDRKHKRYYVGSHWGSPDDGYVCSSNWMRVAKKKRPDDFKRRIVSVVTTTRADLLEEEHRWLQMIDPDHLGKRYYNLRNHHPAHWTASPDDLLSVSEKISKANTGKIKGPPSEETKEKIAAAQRGVKREPTGPRSEEVKQKISDAQKGRKLSPEHAIAHAEAMAKRKGKPGTPQTEEAKLKSSAKQRGRPKSPESVEKVRASINEGWASGRVHPMQGRSHAEETRAKISEAQRGISHTTGKPHTEESKQKMRDGIARSRAEGKGRWANHVKQPPKPKEPKPRKKIVRSPEAIARRRETMARKYAEGYVSPRKGAVFSEEHRRKLSEARRKARP